MADDHADYVHGSQNAATQIADFRMFAALTKWAALNLAVLILVLSLWFCAGVSFLGGLVPGIIVLAIGIAFLRNKRRPVH